MDPHSSTVEVCDGEQAGPLAEEVFAVYDAVFGDHPDMAEWRAELYDKHAARDGFGWPWPGTMTGWSGLPGGTSADAASTGRTGWSVSSRPR